jgi:hypothetical protein
MKDGEVDMIRTRAKKIDSAVSDMPTPQLFVPLSRTAL